MSDECWLTLGQCLQAVIFTAQHNAWIVKTSLSFTKLLGKNSVIYNELGEGDPDDWCTELAQGKPKVMILRILFFFSFLADKITINLENAKSIDRGRPCVLPLHVEKPALQHPGVHP